MSSPPSEDYLEHELVHCRQRYNWDCGLACVMMLLEPAQREEFIKHFDKICNEEGFGQVTWTIDLCYLLKRFGIRHTMYSTMLGVNEAHRKHSYYHNVIDRDRSRVSARFAGAAAAGLQVRGGLRGVGDVARHLARGPALLLVDAGLLACDLCKHNKMRAEFRRYFGGAFSGHYVLVVGRAGGKLLYRDPARPAGLCAAAPARLQRARAPPTDHDVLFIHKDYRR